MIALYILHDKLFTTSLMLEVGVRLGRTAIVSKGNQSFENSASYIPSSF
jgi:hypothetical protein